MESTPLSEKEFDLELEEDLPQNLSKEVNWKEITQTNYPVPFIPRSSLPFERPKNLESFSPVALFKAFFDDSLWEYLETQTNLYLKQKKEASEEYLKGHPSSRLKRYSQISIQQIKRWLAVRLLVPIHSNTKLADNWNKDPLLSSSVQLIMSQDEFWKVSSVFQVSNPQQEGFKTNKVHKIAQFHEMMQQKWNHYYYPGLQITLDEAVIPFSGRLSFLQFMQGKPTRWGIKAFLVSSASTGYVFRMKIYTGKQEGVTTSVQKLVEEMVHPFEEDGHILYADNYYTSVELLKSLREKNIRCTGTIRRNRIRNASLLSRFKKDPKGTIRFFTNFPENNLTLCLWKDRKDVFFISNHRDDRTIFVEDKASSFQEVPLLREYYNKGTRGVDKSNQLCGSYRYNHSEKKWWKTIFEEIIQITMSNMYIIYAYHQRNSGRGRILCRKDFHMEIIKYLMESELIQKPLTFAHYSDWVPLKKRYLHSGVEAKKDFRLNCKNKGCKRKIDLYCPGCSTKDFICSLCVPECFIEYHKKSLR